MKRKYAKASKANAKRFHEAQIEDQLIEIENTILDVFHGEDFNPSCVLSAVHFKENHNVQDNALIVEKTYYIIHQIQIMKLKILNIVNIIAAVMMKQKTKLHVI